MNTAVRILPRTSTRISNLAVVFSFSLVGLVLSLVLARHGVDLAGMI